MNRLVACVLSGMLLALAAPALAGTSTWQGASLPNLPVGGTRSWIDVNNWVGGVVPPAGDIDDFGLTGDGNVTLDGNQAAAGMTLEPWVGYNFSPGSVNPASTLQLNSLQLPPSPVTLTVGDNIRSTSWTDYFIGPWPTAPAPWAVQVGAPQITADLLVPQGLNIVFQGASSGDSSLLLDGKVTGTNAKTIEVSKAGNLQNASLWVTKDNSIDPNGKHLAGCSATINDLGSFGAVHYVDGGNLGAGALTINGGTNSGTLALHCTNSNNLGAPIVYYNTSVSVSTGKFFADRSYPVANPTNNATGGWNAFYQNGGTFMVDNPGGDAQATFTGNNGFNFGIYYMDGFGIGIGNSAGSHTITVDSGVMTSGRGGFLVSSVPANGLNVSLTTVLGDTTSSNPQVNGDGNYFDSGNTLIKNGNGVLQIYVIDWQKPPPGKLVLFKSTGPKHIDAGVLRFSAIVPADAGQVLLNTRDSAVGVAFDGDTTLASFNGGMLALAGGLTTPGQSGAFDLDLNLCFGNGTQNIAEDFINVNANNTRTALRIGSSSDTSVNANTVGIITPSTDANTYFLGGGGGTLTINSVLSDHNNGNTALEMGTSGQLLPGRIILNPGGTSHQNTYTGATRIKAGTLQLATANAIQLSASLSVGTYSTGFNGLYTGAPNGEFNGPGQLLLTPGVPYLGPVNARTLDGGAVGWTANKTIGSLPGTYGATLMSTLANPAGLATNILHLGGEFSSGTMTKTINWIIADINPNSPVALVKSGTSVLDLSLGGANTYSGGTSILGGEIKVSDSNQLGSGPIFLTNAGILHINAAVAVTFNQTLKLYGGPTSGAGLVQVDGTALSAIFTQPIDTTASPQSIVGIDGGGTLDFTGCVVPYPDNVLNGNRWGLYLNNGIIRINQLPINKTNDGYGAQNGALVGNGGVLSVQAAPAGVLVNDPLYGFSSLATYQGTTTTINVADGGLLRINGSVASNFNGKLVISNVGSGEVDIASATPGLDATGNGTIDMGTGTLKLKQLSAAANASKLLPQSTGFTLKLNGGTFIGNVDGSINGNLIINDEASGGSSGFSVIQSVATPNSSALWVVAGSGLTSWNGMLDKEGPGTVQFNRCTGAPVTVAASGVDLLINGGTFIAGGTGDPFTDTATNLSLDILNNSTATGLLISQGVKKVDRLTGTGNTTVSGPAGTELIATSIAQNTLTIGAGCTVMIEAIPGGPTASGANLTPVPEPATWTLLALAAMGLLGWHTRRRT